MGEQVSTQVKCVTLICKRRRGFSESWTSSMSYRRVSSTTRKQDSASDWSVSRRSPSIKTAKGVLRRPTMKLAPVFYEYFRDENRAGNFYARNSKNKTWKIIDRSKNVWPIDMSSDEALKIAVHRAIPICCPLAHLPPKGLQNMVVHIWACLDIRSDNSQSHLVVATWISKDSFCITPMYLFLVLVYENRTKNFLILPNLSFWEICLLLIFWWVSVFFD